MTTTQTSLLPVDPAVSPAQASRVLTIRANLLPDEIKAGRTARRTRSALIVAVVLVVALLGGWYFYAVQHLDSANENLTSATDQVARTQNDKKKYNGVTETINNRDTMTADLKSLMANDLPWARHTDTLRANAAAAGVTIAEISGALVADAPVTTNADGTAAKPAGAATERTVATVTLAGSTPDKPQVAVFLDRLANLKGFADPYLTTLSYSEGSYTYSISLKMTSAALCGRFTAACAATGGN
ncbi:hypothetical protein [Paractinoplanes lichenicola]|uniref:Fimbrial assembly protein n=1 Tax=Paractinoplanes lichenicola TaxID=2802976 RepID=A0ABS1W1J7_9ACTN|nr:hypothetical protein [Actinoplanes lichenicola]MBL7260615.1 hypothetical protein [Actinoplanes lichenicola]